MRIVRVTDDATTDLLYRQVLLPSFPEDQLVTGESLLADLHDGVGEVFVARDDAGALLGGAVGSWYEGPRVMLLSYLAVAEEGRGTGVGSLLLGHLVPEWAERYDPCLIVAEVERPDQHPGNRAHGDSEARLRFYARLGARALDLPYFQPALDRQKARVHGMLLLLLHAAPEFAGEHPESVAAGPLRGFLTEYLVETEGEVARQDPATSALWQGLDRAGGVAVRPVERYAQIAAG
ncbi:GNAT family N-acetyltransferase [Micromonospora sp. 15K316]|uniref:GNAT family N-acetyltransferase n=1 Tax=Micromonospora sp. 15K316 TaxID=2530376 RepID=UPI00104A1DF9|nr:GNAT family N-acetyltransferase [Micromonospora sp. 15K316]TDC38083.1 GNAT family N-acetyltransferase [Micromonospora sp. 15K316]